MFPTGERSLIATELVHVLEKTFLTVEKSKMQTQCWLKNPYVVSRALINSWEDASFLWLQAGGESQKDLHKIMDHESKKLGFPQVSSYKGTCLFVYVDDISVHGTRVLNDLSPWIKAEAPERFELLLLFHVQLVDSRTWVVNEIENRARDLGKTANVQWWADEVFQVQDCYQSPFSTPNMRGKFFSNKFDSCILGTALFKAGEAILASSESLRANKYMRPLGNSIKYRYGLGVPYVTWRNCPNSAPLALWAGGKFPALFPRECN